MQRSGFHLGSIRGTTIQVEVSFLILTGLFVLIDLESRQPMRIALLWIPVLFVSVLLHELAHAAAIGAFGYGSSQIVLSSFGGVTLNRREAKPWQDMLISLAGPVSSFLLAFASAMLAARAPAISRDPMLALLVPMMARTNLVWGLFNLLPVFPLDGGQALRNLLRVFTAERTATAVSVWVSLLLAAAVLIYGIFSRWFFLAIIAAMLLMQNYRRWQASRHP